MTASERSYQAFLDRRAVEGLRRSLTEVAAPAAEVEAEPSHADKVADVDWQDYMEAYPQTGMREVRDDDRNSLEATATRRETLAEHLEWQLHLCGLDLDELASEAALSPFHFHRVFRGMTGETPLELHRRLRLERAAWHFGASTKMIAIYHHDPETTPESELRADAAITIPDGAPVPEGLTESRIAAGRYARATHTGPYEGLGDAWARLMGEWLPRSGHRVGDGVAYELYRNNPTQVPREQLITDLFVPIK